MEKSLKNATRQQKVNTLIFRIMIQLLEIVITALTKMEALYLGLSKEQSPKKAERNTKTLSAHSLKVKQKTEVKRQDPQN